MQDITVNLVMDRLLVNPVFKGIKYGVVASYMKDFASINGIQPILTVKSAIVQVANYKGQLPADVLQVKAIYLCDGLLPDSLYEDNRLAASLTDNILRTPRQNEKKDFYASYMIQDDIITTDTETVTLEIQYRGIRTDENGFPVLIYDGSLLMALTNFVKWQHLLILADSEMVPASRAQEAHREYAWYIGQYTTKNEVPTYDEAVSWGNAWTRLYDTRNKSKQGDNLEQHYPLGNNRYGINFNN